MTALSDWMYWLLWIGAIIVFALMIYVAWWALFADRARGRRRCPRCWYDMAYSPGMTCAECGFTGHAEANFSRTRRRWKVASLAILICVILAGAIHWRVEDGGWTGMMPTNLLLMSLPLANDPYSANFMEIVQRASMGRLSDEQWAALIDRCVKGDWRARPPGDDWIAKYGEFLWAWRGSFTGDKAIEPKLLTIPPRLEARTREVWPVGSSAVVLVQVVDWWPTGTECRLRATPRINGSSDHARTTIFYRTSNHRLARGGFPLAVDGIDQNTRTIEIDFEIAQRRTGSGNPWRTVDRQTVVLKTTASGELAQAFQPVDSPVMADAIRATFARGVVKWNAGSSPVRFNIDLQTTLKPELNDTAIGIAAELYRGDALARRLNLWWIGGSANAPNTGLTGGQMGGRIGAGGQLGGQLGGLIGANRNYGYEIDYEDAELLAAAGAPESTEQLWTLRVRSDPALALRAGNAAKFWSGEFSIPIKFNFNSGQSPPRPWWTDDEESGVRD